ncbi:hypothetical protein JVT61DRAFT_14974 [Boletus reticuloceps]|uniref:Crinkler effector protein N-terminal domain-containing protein n=1 Tax=Boletus reticuloceps TaxID=495285 RepID=A0A8I3A275_9AGAM|nr:hypothetical protein JVT61DRAFT_14974 [Boletus reticuloceps]
MDVLRLICWIRSQDPEATFQVKISKTETVFDLHKAIKNENPIAFRDVDVATLRLYKPNYPVSQPYEDHLHTLNLSDHGKFLQGAQRLSKVFLEPPPEDDIHVIIHRHRRFPADWPESHMFDAARSHFEHSEDSIAKDRSQEKVRSAGLLEVLHTAYHVAAYEWQGCWQRDGPCRRPLKQHLMESMFFDLLLMARNRKAVVQRDKDSPITVVVKCDDDVELRQYCPRSDFSISIFTLPRLLVEVNSTSQDSWPMDLIRMLTTGAFIVRFANKFVSRFKEKKNFVLCAIFISDDGTTIRYTLFQNQNDETAQPSQVYYNKLQFSSNGAHERVKFVRSLYNLLFVELDQDPYETAKGAISELHNRIKDRHLKSFHTKNPTGHSRKRRRTDNNNDDGAGGGVGNEKCTNA